MFMLLPFLPVVRIHIPNRPIPRYPPCVDHERTKRTQTERRLSPSHAVIIIRTVILHSYLQGCSHTSPQLPIGPVLAIMLPVPMLPAPSRAPMSQ